MDSRRTRILTISLLVAVGLACGGGGGRRGGDPPTDPGPSVVFLPAGSGAAQSLELASPTVSGTSFTVRLLVEQIADLYAVSFDLSYPTDFVRYVSTQEADHLSSGGLVSTSLQVVEQPPGNLVVGLSRLGDVAGAGGSGTLLFLTFEASASGEGQLRFVDPSAFDSEGDEIAGLTWNGGTVRATF